MNAPNQPQQPTPPQGAPIGQPDAAGRMSFQMPNGGKVVVEPNGTVSLDLQHIKTIGIQNIIDVAVHNISSVVGVVSHYVKFHNGGELRFAYNTQGQLIELSFTGIHVTISDDAQLSFSCQQPAVPNQT